MELREAQVKTQIQKMKGVSQVEMHKRSGEKHQKAIPMIPDQVSTVPLPLLRHV